MRQYLNLLETILEQGVDSSDRTGTGRRRMFGAMMRFNMKDGLPLVTTREVFTSSLIHELLWFIKGGTNVNNLDTAIWNKWAVKQEHIEAFAEKYDGGDEDTRALILHGFPEHFLGSVGPMYGAAWRNSPQYLYHDHWPKIAMDDIPKDKLAGYIDEYNNREAGEEDEVSLEEYCNYRYRGTVDQLNDLIIGLRDRPYSARHIVNAWIPQWLPFEDLKPQENVMLARGSLAPCHMSFTCFVYPPETEGGKKRLSLSMHLRSSDSTVGQPYNLAQYSVLLLMLAHVTDMEAHEFVCYIDDCHIYQDQIELAKEQIKREPRPLPTLWLNPEVKSIFDFTFDDIKIENYNPHERIDYPVSI